MFLHKGLALFTFLPLFWLTLVFILIGKHFLLLFINRGLCRSGALVLLVSAIRQFTFKILSELGAFN
jgi:hypothetical protein